MRVMVVSNIFPPHARGGYELGLLEVARAFTRAGHEVEVVTSATVGRLNKTAGVTDLPVRYVLAPVFAYESDMSDLLDASPEWRARRTEAFGGVIPANVVTLAGEIRRYQPDAIWLGNPLGLGPVGIMETALGAGVPVVIHLMDHVDRYLTGYQRPLQWLARIRRLKRSLTAVSCSALIRDANSLVGTYGRHVVVHNGFDFRSVAVRARPGSHDGPLRFVYAGQLEPLKGIPQLIEGVSRLARDGTADVELDLIGPASASYADALARELAERRLSDRVRLIGRVEKSELLRRLASYDAAVMLLKLDEPFAYAPIEAAAVGLPVIATRGAAIAEAFPPDYPLFVDDRDDPAGVACVLRWAVDHRRTLGGLGRALGVHLRRVCDTETVVNPKYLEVLRTAPPPAVPSDEETLLAAAITYDAFGLAQEGWRLQ